MPSKDVSNTFTRIRGSIEFGQSIVDRHIRAAGMTEGNFYMLPSERFYEGLCAGHSIQL
jgi:hypothetical protein